MFNTSVVGAELVVTAVSEIAKVPAAVLLKDQLVVTVPDAVRVSANRVPENAASAIVNSIFFILLSFLHLK